MFWPDAYCIQVQRIGRTQGRIRTLGADLLFNASAFRIDIHDEIAVPKNSGRAVGLSECRADRARRVELALKARFQHGFDATYIDAR